ncbi:polyribonucleotide nucleotidyltransferase, partial [Candidatus Azambacteria bacterium]|nr:polyribonucleotide nucleotidyltransferase [Candidatus Azambacteria bacterium]
MEKRTFTHEIDGRPLTIEVSDLAGQANGSVLARFGETVVLATAVMAKTAREGIAYFPLLVDYEERFYAAGKISGSRFIKREGRPSEEAILTGRLIDRALRPRFNQRMRNDVQVVLTVLSFDGANDPDIPALVAASTALTISDIPWAGPLGAVRVSKNGSSWRINPTYPERTESPVDLVAAGVKDRINMLEARGKEVPEGEVLEAITKSEEPIQALIRFQEEIQKDVGRAKAAVPL